MSESSEAQAVSRRWGKWSDPGVPHKGWSCVGTNDLGPDEADWQTCEMCEAMSIRYVHAMTHPDYDGQLECGCVCAGNMEQDLTAARHREAEMKSSARRRLAFLRLKSWRMSQRRNPWIKYHGWHVVIYPRGGGYGGRIERNGRQQVAQRVYPSADAAKLAAFDAMARAEAKGR